MKSYNTRIPFEAGKVYHAFNRGNNRERIFFTHSNYLYFLNLYATTLGIYVDTFAYCLIPNHYHFLFRIKPNTNILDFRRELRRFLVTYSKSINKQEGRTGSLFTKSIKRKEVYDDSYLKRIAFYIHHNPVKHELYNDFKSYPYSSYQAIIANKKLIIARDQILEWFNSDIEEFLDFHNYLHDENITKAFIIE